MSKKVLSFGHLPKYSGGKQSSGLASVIWELSDNINKLESVDFKYVLAATDVYVKKIKIGSTDVLGWVKKDLLLYIILRPWVLFFYGLKAGKIYYKYKLPYFNCLIKMIFYHKTIKKVKPSLIHLHGCTSVVFFEIFNIKKYNIIVTIHGLSGQDISIPSYKNYQLMEKELSLLPLKVVVFITSEVLRHWVSAYGVPVWDKKVILNAYNKKLFYYTRNDSNIKKKKYNIATVASISSLKGQIRVLEALKGINNNNIHYVCIGEGREDEIQFLENFAKANNISFECTGYLSPSHIRERLSNTDYMILPSSSEGFGLVFLESIACGVPVILPKHLPILKEDNLLNKQNSILLDDESSKSIAKVLSNLDFYFFLNDKVSKTVLNYSWDIIAKEYINLIKSIN